MPKMLHCSSKAGVFGLESFQGFQKLGLLVRVYGLAVLTRSLDFRLIPVQMGLKFDSVSKRFHLDNLSAQNPG